MPRSLKHAPKPDRLTRLRGYEAAFICIERSLLEAKRHLPRRLSWKHQRLAAYREGYYMGLLTAHCQSALGEHPECNAKEIEAIIKPSPSPQQAS